MNESANLMILSGDHVRFIGTVECTQALRVGNREGMVFPAHSRPAGSVPRGPAAEQPRRAVCRGEAERADERPEPHCAASLRTAREHGFAINSGRTESGLTAVGRAVRLPGERAEAALSLSLPTVRFSKERLPQQDRPGTDGTGHRAGPGTRALGGRLKGRGSGETGASDRTGEGVWSVRLAAPGRGDGGPP